MHDVVQTTEEHLHHDTTSKSKVEEEILWGDDPNQQYFEYFMENHLDQDVKAGNSTAASPTVVNSSCQTPEAKAVILLSEATDDTDHIFPSSISVSDPYSVSAVTLWSSFYCSRLQTVKVPSGLNSVADDQSGAISTLTGPSFRSMKPDDKWNSSLKKETGHASILPAEETFKEHGQTRIAPAGNDIESPECHANVQSIEATGKLKCLNSKNLGQTFIVCFIIALVICVAALAAALVITLIRSQPNNQAFISHQKIGSRNNHERDQFTPSAAPEYEDSLLTGPTPLYPYDSIPDLPSFGETSESSSLRLRKSQMPSF
jgi:hypothetical protein